MAIVSKQTIDDFYKKKRIAVIGASRDKKKYGRMLFEQLRKRDYDAIPVNPNADEIGGVKCYASVKNVQPRPEAVIAVVPPAEQEKVVNETADAGVTTIWLHEHVMKGVSNPDAIGQCKIRGLECIVGFCPLMFIPKTAFYHRMHGAFMKLFGAYPR